MTISGTVFDQVKNCVQVRFDLIGEQEVKNIAEQVRTYRVRSLDEHALQQTDPTQSGMSPARRGVLAALRFTFFCRYGGQQWIVVPFRPFRRGITRETTANNTVVPVVV